MIIDCRTWKNKDRETVESERRLIFVDGVEIHGVFYVDTDAGIVRTYHVIEDMGVTATHGLTPELRNRGLREGWDMPIGGVVSKTIRGAVELRPL